MDPRVLPPFSWFAPRPITFGPLMQTTEQAWSEQLSLPFARLQSDFQLHGSTCLVVVLCRLAVVLDSWLLVLHALLVFLLLLLLLLMCRLLLLLLFSRLCCFACRFLSKRPRPLDPEAIHMSCQSEAEAGMVPPVFVRFDLQVDDLAIVQDRSP